MQISGTSLLSPSLMRGMSDLRDSFDSLNKQLSSGKVADNYADLGDGRALSLAMRSSVARMSGYQTTISRVNLKLSGATAALQQINTLAASQRNDTVVTSSPIITSTTDKTGAVVGQTQAQVAAGLRLTDALAALNTDVAGSYLFSGSDTNTQPVLDSDTILNGRSGQSGLIDVIGERRKADVGHIDLTGSPATAGRLTVSDNGTGTVTLAKDASVFGFKLGAGAVTSTLDGPSVTQSASAPYAIAIQDTGTQAKAGQVVTVKLSLPDGTSTSLTLTATDGDPATGQFKIGATSAATLANLKTALTSGLSDAAQSTLAAASAMKASSDFFAAGPNTPPVRVNLGSPPGAPEDATSAIGDAANTVVWYQGQDSVSGTPAVKDGGKARATMTAQIDLSVKISYGAEANERGIAQGLAAIGAMAATSFSADQIDAKTSTLSSSNAKALNNAMVDRVRDALQVNNGANSVVGITTELAGATEQSTAVSTRLKAAQNAAQDAIDSVENADPTAIYAQISEVQTRLQASYQTASLLSKLSLVNYLG